MALSIAAHWNQNEEDWRTMLALGQGWGLRRRDEAGRDTLVASALVLPYGTSFAWISMVLVLPAFRRQGYGQRLLAVALEYLALRRLLPMLDATPAGRPVYLKQGFVDVWGLERWRRNGNVEAVRPSPQPAARARRLRESDWNAIEAFDAPAFGASRQTLLRALAMRLPRAAWVVEDEKGPRGYLLGRDGRTAMQLGPLVADDDDAALTLLSCALGAIDGDSGPRRRDVVVDLRNGRTAIATRLRSWGFAPERPLMRMVRVAEYKSPADAWRICLVVGPELG